MAKWSPHLDGEHVYFLNSETGESVWEKPQNYDGTEWIECFDADNNAYFYHFPTGETSWERPTQEKAPATPAPGIIQQELVAAEERTKKLNAEEEALKKELDDRKRRKREEALAERERLAKLDAERKRGELELMVLEEEETRSYVVKLQKKKELLAKLSEEKEAALRIKAQEEEIERQRRAESREKYLKEREMESKEKQQKWSSEVERLQHLWATERQKQRERENRRLKRVEERLERKRGQDMEQLKAKKEVLQHFDKMFPTVWDGAAYGCSAERFRELLMLASAEDALMGPMPIEIDGQNEIGETLLHICCWRGALEHVEVLLEMGADVDRIDGAVNRCTPLHEAVRGMHGDIVALLLRHGADVRRADTHGDTALHWASRLGCWGIAVQLLKAKDGKECLQKKNFKGRVPAELADSRAVLDLLLEHDAAPNDKDLRSFVPWKERGMSFRNLHLRHIRRSPPSRGKKRSKSPPPVEERAAPRLSWHSRALGLVSADSYKDLPI